jgi:hypothetical protein
MPEAPVFRLTTPDEREEGYTLANELFWTLLRLNEEDHAALCTATDHPDSVYTHLTNALHAVLRQLGVDPAHIPTTLDCMGDGLAVDEAIEVVREEMTQTS